MKTLFVTLAAALLALPAMANQTRTDSHEFHAKKDPGWRDLNKNVCGGHISIDGATSGKSVLVKFFVKDCGQLKIDQFQGCAVESGGTLTYINGSYQGEVRIRSTRYKQKKGEAKSLDDVAYLTLSRDDGRRIETIKLRF